VLGRVCSASGSSGRTIQEVEASAWLKAVLGEPCEDIYESLRSGVLLCTLLNKIKPGLIKKINKVSPSRVEWTDGGVNGM
jgi:hypothetical protein